MGAAICQAALGPSLQGQSLVWEPFPFSFKALAVHGRLRLNGAMTRDMKESLGARKGNGASGDAQELTQLLVAVSEQRDRAAFADLFRALSPRLKGFALQLGCSPASAEELVQDVMLTVWRRARQFDPAKGKAASWIYTIARNRRIDLLRRERYVRVDRAVEDGSRWHLRHRRQAIQKPTNQ